MARSPHKRKQLVVTNLGIFSSAHNQDKTSLNAYNVSNRWKSLGRKRRKGSPSSPVTVILLIYSRLKIK